MRPAALLLSMALAGCVLDSDGSELALPDLPPAPDVPPEWASSAVWYQIFPERFRNGDIANDPIPSSMEGAYPRIPTDSLEGAGWAVRDWTSDWYARDAWERSLRPDAFYVTVQARRYGGDLQGVLDRLPYLDSLGVTALYLNPVNDSPSLHKYDARTYRHVDPHFGPDPAGDRDRIALEDPTDPETWGTTAADGLLLDVLEAAHERDMRVVLDVSFNHTGTQFWAFQDILENGRDAETADWYAIDTWDDPATPEDEFAYTGWAGVPSLPEFLKVGLEGDPEQGIPYDGDLATGPKAHALAVAVRWLDPNGDGDPSDGVDGFRLDVAEQVPLGFWEDMRRVVKAVNPQAILIGEIWWQRWPDTLMDPAPYLGDAFDSVMHYRPFPVLRQFLDPDGPQVSAADVAAELGDIYASVPPRFLPALVSMSGSHDTPRLATTLQNAGVPYKNEETPRVRAGYDVSRPSSAAFRSVRLFRLLQAVLPGAPHVYYGDEVGMWGADDPDDRKPMLWPDLEYEPETALPDGSSRPADRVEVDRDLLAFTRRALRLRRDHSELFATGTVSWEPSGDVLVFQRRGAEETAVVIVNASSRTERVSVGAVMDSAALVLNVGPRPGRAGGALTLAPRSGAVFIAPTR
ncbi:glycoside hydrolase family 13 protein [Rubrivirga sp.]|uniref:glycoside hydrolase family 13 protein n=1 Tax=Rubrivirga sp. TaxID=1885344 RepID=UPI003C75FEA0